MPDHDRSAGGHAPESEPAFPLAAPRSDLLSQVLGLIRLRGELVVSAELTDPWALQFDPGAGYFHILSEGETWIETADGTVVRAMQGDLLVMPQGRGHRIGTPGTASQPIRDVIAGQLRDDRMAIRLGGNGPLTRMVIGAFRFEGDNMTSMLAVLPPVIHIPRAMLAEESDWIDGLSHFLLAEAGEPHPGASLMISRLIDVLVIRTMRTWVRTAPPEAKGWLGALADARIARALKAIHDEPFRRWTVAGLAGIAGMSRSSFAERFAALTGAAPLHYQTRWKLLLAQDMLKRADTRVSDVARRIGYESDAAFSRAFKAQFGIPPVMARPGGG